MSSPFARGCFHYSRDGQALPIHEDWVLWGNDDAPILSGRRWVQGQAVLRIRARYAGAHCQHLSLRWQSRAEDAPQYWTYRKQGNRLLVRCGPEVARLMELPADCALFPLLRAATPFLIRSLGEAGGKIVLPNIGLSPEQPGFLQPLISERSLQQEPQDSGHGQAWRMVGGPYQLPGACFELDARGLLQRYQWQAPDGLWLCEEASASPR